MTSFFTIPGLVIDIFSQLCHRHPDLYHQDCSLLKKSAALAMKGLGIGIAKTFKSVVVDPTRFVSQTVERIRHPEGRTALLIIDAQRDFTSASPDGAHEAGKLPVSGGYEIVPVANKLMDGIAPGNVVAASLDWHPARHRSFASSTGRAPYTWANLGPSQDQSRPQLLWPDHCVQGTRGSRF